ncbi:MAG: PIG-L deacetylase family protein [Noviherbaspirillum sp.]
MTSGAAATGREIRGAGTAEASWQSWAGLRNLPSIDLGQLAPPGRRILVLAPHPDDELLGCGGLIRLLAGLGREVQVVAVTDGGASHPGSARWPSALLMQERARESAEALRRLGAPGVPLLRLGLDDGQLTAQMPRLVEMLDQLVAPGDLLVATWRRDGHPDHEAVGAAAACLAGRHGLRLLEMPVWMWHWAEAGDRRVPWERACRLRLDEASHAAKQDAALAYRSQLEPDPSTGRDAIVPASALARVLRNEEVYFR